MENLEGRKTPTRQPQEYIVSPGEEPNQWITSHRDDAGPICNVSP